MGLLTRMMIDTLQQADSPLVVERVPCPELGDEVFVFVKMLTCAQAEVHERIGLQNGREVYGALAAVGLIAPQVTEKMNLDMSMSIFEARHLLENPPSTRLPLVIATACDATGACLFTDDDTAWLLQQAPPLINRLYDMAWKLNSTGNEVVEKAVKNFATSQRNDSGTDSHSNGAALSASANNC